MAAKEMFAEPTFLECGFGELEHKVIGQGTCCLCGNCLTFCPRIGVRNHKPTLLEYDPLCGLCYAYCPRTFFDMPKFEEKIFGRSRTADEALGIYRTVSAARATPIRGQVQDGGVVTALLIHALESGQIDCAVVTDRNSRWQTSPKVATTPEEIVAAAGTKYTITPSIAGIQMAMDQGFTKIGFTGTPCQIQALRKAQLLEEPYRFGQEKIALLIGLFCMENFDYQKLMSGLVKEKFGLQPNDVTRFEIQKGMFRAVTPGGVKEVPLDETDPFTWPGCGPCFDFSAELADVSVGSVGSPAGWSTVLVRTKEGEALYSSAISSGKIESQPVTEKALALVRKLAGNKVARFESNAERLRSSGVKFDVVRI
ncbi:MAG: Coenzyme F420 hydrogenase subunit beta [Methanosaeta sp. PtaB.Bin039]|nr:MAG: Coenzyme F420 hydrogenase subunit beta [Methanosaeta sp. PtaB.Bin039]OPY47788.1 MAG: Coenzyme F420 hydrogenase subunit beta [Methanosaeta sp. PtaU1.Bin028]